MGRQTVYESVVHHITRQIDWLIPEVNRCKKSPLRACLEKPDKKSDKKSEAKSQKKKVKNQKNVKKSEKKSKSQEKSQKSEKKSKRQKKSRKKVTYAIFQVIYPSASLVRKYKG